MNHIEAMKRALDTIDSAHADMRDEITALRQAIEQAEKQFSPDWDTQVVLIERIRELEKQLYGQEPVAWQDTQEKCRIEVVPAKGGLMHTAPPRKEWVGLTDEERDLIARDAAKNDWHDYIVISATEAVLRSKNNG